MTEKKDFLGVFVKYMNVNTIPTHWHMLTLTIPMLLHFKPVLCRLQKHAEFKRVTRKAKRQGSRNQFSWNELLLFAKRNFPQIIARYDPSSHGIAAYLTKQSIVSWVKEDSHHYRQWREFLINNDDCVIMLRVKWNIAVSWVSLASTDQKKTE